MSRGHRAVQREILHRLDIPDIETWTTIADLAGADTVDQLPHREPMFKSRGDSHVLIPHVLRVRSVPPETGRVRSPLSHERPTQWPVRTSGSG
jgi:hypothetical protein